MSADALLAELVDAGIRLSANGDRLHIEARRGAVSPELRAKLVDHKPELLVLLRQQAVRGPRPVVNFRLLGSPAGIWATAIGREGETRESLVADLLSRWPNAEIQP